MKPFYKYIILAALTLLPSLKSSANPYPNRISGKITDAKSLSPIHGAAVVLEGTYLWATTAQDGTFNMSGIQNGTYKLKVFYLGYADSTFDITINDDVSNITIALKENTLAIDEVVVTAQTRLDNPATTIVIGNDALKHMQITNISDISALLPGGKTINPDLTSNKTFSLRDGGSSTGNVGFGTAIEVDGVRINNNGVFGSLSGVSTRNIAVQNIDYIEVITGIPSVEYGDLNSGMVKIHTLKGSTPWQILTAVNPRTQQVAVSKGFDLGNNNGVLNVSTDWTKATAKLTSPYSSYTRRGISATYSNTFKQKLKFEAAVSGNIGGMNTEDDPDAYSGEYTKERDNFLRANTSLTWLLNKSWITNLKLEASVNYNDTRLHAHTYYSYASEQPAVHATEEGYFFAEKLPYNFFADQIIDSKAIEYAASLKYEWNRSKGRIRNKVKAGLQWKSTGNAGEGEYYLQPSYAPTGYRPRPYSSYPFMHNLAVYVEENMTLPLGVTRLDLMAGLRMENVFIDGTEYKNLNTFSPRFNVRWHFAEGFSLRGGWGVTEKLPSYHVLYPIQQYRDIQTFGVSYNNNESSYVYYTQPHKQLYNKELKWQRNQNSEIGLDMEFSGLKITASGYINRTKLPYRTQSVYTPFSYNILELPEGYTVPANPEIKVDNQTGLVYVRGDRDDYWTAMDIKVEDKTFAKSTYSDNGCDVVRKGIELIVDFPEIQPIKTKVRFDGTYTYTKYLENTLAPYYQSGWSHTSIPNRSYQYVGIYANNGSTSMANGRRTNSIDANITAVTHIPRARLIISCRLEMSLLKRSQNLSEYQGKQYAFNVNEEGKTSTGGSIYNGNSYTAIWPVAYMDTEGNVLPFTETEANDPAFANLILKSGNAYTFSRDGYDPYFSANLSITKEIGDHVSLSFFANNFTNSRRYVNSYATGVSAIFTPDFYYGLTCRLKF